MVFLLFENAVCSWIYDLLYLNLSGARSRIVYKCQTFHESLAGLYSPGYQGF